MPRKKNRRSDRGPVHFVTEYRHYRTGKLMRARDYGYAAWPFGGPRRRKR